MIDLINMRAVGRKQYDDVWIIARSVRSCPSGARVVNDLSPSWDLVKKYWGWRDSGQWNAQTFANKYLPQFLNELNGNSRAKNLMNDLYRMDKQGKRVALVCYCGDESLCHRSIVGGILAYNGVSVHATKDINDYLKYGEMYDAVAKSGKTALSDVHKGLHSGSNVYDNRVSMLSDKLGSIETKDILDDDLGFY